MARHSDDSRPERGSAAVTTTLLLLATLTLAALVCLALVSWFERMP